MFVAAIVSIVHLLLFLNPLQAYVLIGRSIIPLLFGKDKNPLLMDVESFLVGL